MFSGDMIAAFALGGATQNVDGLHDHNEREHRRAEGCGDAEGEIGNLHHVAGLTHAVEGFASDKPGYRSEQGSTDDAEKCGQ
jgi:hypothetical protein